MVVDAVFSERVSGKNSLLTGNKNFGSGKETRRTGKPGDRKGKFVSDKICDDAKNISISLKGCSSPVSSHVRNMQRSTEMSPFCNFVLCPVYACSEKLPCLLTPLLKGEYFFHVQGTI